MSPLRQAILGVLAALVSSIVVIGSLTLSLVEGGLPIAQVPAVSTVANTFRPQPPIPTPKPGEPTFTPTPSPQPTPTPTLSQTCPNTPPDWILITVQMGDSLAGLAEAYGTTPETLKQANCLIIDDLPPGYDVFVPPPPTLTALPPTEPPVEEAPPEEPPAQPGAECGAPAGWVTYVVRPGDTLFKIGSSYGVSVAQLQQANCLGRSTVIRVGQRLFVPNIPQRTLPPPTATRTPAPSATLAPTATQFPTATRTLPPTSAPRPTSTNTTAPTEAPTPMPLPTETDTSVPTSTSTNTPQPSPTSPPTTAPTNTSEPTATKTTPPPPPTPTTPTP